MTIDKTRSGQVNTRNDGGSAFPRAPFEFTDRTTGLDWSVTEQRGMTLRDWFAGMSLTQIGNTYSKAIAEGMEPHEDPAEVIAMMAYAFADEMLKERDKA